MKSKFKSSVFFKNLYLFQITKGWFPGENDLLNQRLIPCGDADLSTAGWVPVVHDRMLLRVERHLLIRLGMEEKILPPAAINHEFDKRIQQLETNFDRFLTRSERNELKELVMREMARKAFTKTRHTSAWIDSERGVLAIDTTSENRVNEVRSALHRLNRDLEFKFLHTRKVAPDAMTAWLMQPSVAPFDVMDSCVLKGEDGKVTYSNEDLSGSDVIDQISRGMVVVRLALEHNQRILFTLDSSGVFRKVSLTDVATGKAMEEPVEDVVEKMSVDLTLMAYEYRGLIESVLSALGGALNDSQDMAA
ncbi:MAG: recombination-dependent growth factor [Pseudomonadota bacterium]|jgi:recombination associated protein RdgC